MEIGNAARVVLPPVPERPRRLAPDLPTHGAIPEDAQLVQRARLEQDDGEGRKGRDGEADGESRRGPPPGVREPERGDDQRGELREARERAERAPESGPRHEPEAPD